VAILLFLCVNPTITGRFVQLDFGTRF
jgi:hypothetical protein